MRTLAFMGYYGAAERHDALGYRAGSEGWDARGGGERVWERRAGAAAPEPEVAALLERAGRLERGHDRA